MTEPAPQPVDAEVVREGVPPKLPEALRKAKMGYHRVFLAFSAVLLVACFLLPAPNGSGEIRLPFLAEPTPSLCMLKRECGIDCPGCGLTRCFLSMGHARYAAAWGFHPVGVVLFLVLAAQVPYRAYQLYRLRRGDPELSHWALRSVLWLLLAAILGQWILRMTCVLSA